MSSIISFPEITCTNILAYFCNSFLSWYFFLTYLRSYYADMFCHVWWIKPHFRHTTFYPFTPIQFIAFTRTQLIPYKLYYREEFCFVDLWILKAENKVWQIRWNSYCWKYLKKLKKEDRNHLLVQMTSKEKGKPVLRLTNKSHRTAVYQRILGGASNLFSPPWPIYDPQDNQAQAHWKPSKGPHE